MGVKDKKNLKKSKTKQKFMNPFLCMGFNASRLQSHYKETVYFLSRPWAHLVVLNVGPLDWESSTLITWPLWSFTEKSNF